MKLTALPSKKPVKYLITLNDSEIGNITLRST